MTDPATDREALGLFEAMLAVPEAEREGWIAERTAGKPELAARLAAIREADRRASLRTGGAIEVLEEETQPERIGAYRIVARIGRGGMGAVYLGERTTGDFAHVAAIKLIKQGLLSEALVDRFQRERQTLADLRHPNITQLYDGGEMPGGSPYFVMEYVDGLPLLDWVAEQRPDRTQLLRLFAAICDAVGFANRNLVVHRDLTPSNVLVTRDGTVKLIDFGIARPVEEAGDGDPARASIGSLSLTPGYAAPERMVSAQVTTAADVYSLGKLLERLIPDAAGDREFAAIVGKATATDPAARYASADALASDVDAWDRGFPLQAMPAGNLYPFRKFISRHPVGTALAALALILLLGALAVTLNAYSRAENARRAEAARFDELRSLARYMLFDLDGRLERVAGNTTARSDLARRAQTYLSALAASRDTDAGLKLEAAQGFNRLAQIQGLPTEPNLGQRDEAKASLQQADRLLLSLPQDMAGRGPALASNRLYRAMIALHGDADQAAAEQLLGQAFTTLDAVAVAQRDNDWRGVKAELLHGRVETLLLSGKLDELPAMADRIASEVEAWPAALRRSGEAEFERAYADYVRGLALNNLGSPAEALPFVRRAEERLVRLDGQRPGDPNVLNLLAWAAYEGYGAGSEANPTEARRFLALARRTIDRLTAIESADRSLRSFAVNIRQAQAEALAEDGAHDAAVALQREVIVGRTEAARAKPGVASFSRIGMAELIQGNIALRAGDRTLACRSYRAAQVAFARARSFGPLLGRSEDFETGVSANVTLCAANGAPRPVT